MHDALHATPLPPKLKQKLEALVGKEVEVKMSWKSSRHKGLHMMEDEEYDKNEGSHKGNVRIASVGEFGFFVFGTHHGPLGRYEALESYDSKQRIFAAIPIPEGQSYVPFRQSSDTYFQNPEERGDDYRSIYHVSEVVSISHEGSTIYAQTSS